MSLEYEIASDNSEIYYRGFPSNFQLKHVEINEENFVTLIGKIDGHVVHYVLNFKYKDFKPFQGCYEQGNGIYHLNKTYFKNIDEEPNVGWDDGLTEEQKTIVEDNLKRIKDELSQCLQGFIFDHSRETGFTKALIENELNKTLNHYSENTDLVPRFLELSNLTDLTAAEEMELSILLPLILSKEVKFKVELIT